MKLVNLTGKRFGRLVAIRCVGSRQQGKRRAKFWLCKCDCGNFTEVRTAHLTTGQTFGCGCKQKLPKGESAFNSLYFQYQRNASIRGLSFELTKKQFRCFTQESCFYCGNEPSNIIDVKKQNGVYVYSGIDRLDNLRGYSKENCVSCCKVCNWMKNTMSYKEFIEHITKICTVSTVA
ncbi:hypothetical protein LCGC14_1131250 [marine sediment metagenome]|uniref:Uncharacterized protein n=1 Tax=marine sediment metagenome TaxID=412755 RepID=A0A0F9MNS8_9ZZZZ